MARKDEKSLAELMKSRSKAGDSRKPPKKCNGNSSQEGGIGLSAKDVTRRLND